eukprot:TRINITY_DN1936_c0_g2_i2.p1 TRINITY_DN1936_c0_g2~~TRINITY_DN1936_c0_g2_i2.p1  ORF type:complete len:150 (+),score=28.69 TRINITY_DN1936_c0_g2_i2:569-1018(+)
MHTPLDLIPRSYYMLLLATYDCCCRGEGEAMAEGGFDKDEANDDDMDVMPCFFNSSNTKSTEGDFSPSGRGRDGFASASHIADSRISFTFVAGSGNTPVHRVAAAAAAAAVVIIIRGLLEFVPCLCAAAVTTRSLPHNCPLLNSTGLPS